MHPRDSSGRRHTKLGVLSLRPNPLCLPFADFVSYPSTVCLVLLSPSSKSTSGGLEDPQHGNRMALGNPKKLQANVY